jgi:Fic family protein
MRFLDHSLFSRYAEGLLMPDVHALRVKCMHRTVQSEVVAHIWRMDARNLHIMHRIVMGDESVGVYRQTAVRTLHNGTFTYTAPIAERIRPLLNQLFDELNLIVRHRLTDLEVLFYASQVHVAILAIHPFTDGNGRLARMMERWFVAQQWGRFAWHIQNDRHIYSNRIEYIDRLAAMGRTFDELNWNKSIPVLRMLPDAIAEQLART